MLLKAKGNSLEVGKIYYISCVGGCADIQRHSFLGELNKQAYLVSHCE